MGLIDDILPLLSDLWMRERGRWWFRLATAFSIALSAVIILAKLLT